MKWFIPLVAFSLTLFAQVMGAEPEPAGNPQSKADRPPRKVVVGTTIFGPYGQYPGLSERLKVLGGLVDEMARRASDQYPGQGLDLAILPETSVTSTTGSAAARAIRLEGPVREAFGRLARTHKTYIVVPMDLAEEGPQGGMTYSNAAVLFDRQGEVTGIYRKVHPVAVAGRNDLEGGIAPGRGFPVFDCDFGKLGIQICWDVQFEEGWAALAGQGAEIVAWPTASPATAQPASRAARHRYYVVSSTWRDDATIFEPTGLVAAQVETPAKVLVHQLDLSFAVLGWSAPLRNGKALRERYGDRVGFHYEPREDVGLFWSNDSKTTVGAMAQSIGAEELDAQLERNRRLYAVAGVKAIPGMITVRTRKPEDRFELATHAGGETLTIRSPSGIGGVDLERAGDRWPDRLVVRLRLKGLESIKLSNGTARVSGSTSAQGEASPRFSLVRNDQDAQPIDKSSPYFVVIRAIDGGFEFDLPEAFFGSNPNRVTVEWVDFYR